MENGDKSGARGASESPGTPGSPGGTRRLKEYYEQLWSGSKTGSPVHEQKISVDVKAMERRLEEQRQARRMDDGAGRERVTLRHSSTATSTPATSPRSRDVLMGSRWASGSSSPSSSAHESFEEVAERTTEEGDLAEVDGRWTGGKVVQFERVTMHRSVREVVRKSPARTPSEEQLTREDSAYLSQRSLGSRTSSVASLVSGRSEESLLDDQHQWYQEYQHELQSGRKEVQRRSSQYDSRIQEIRGQ